MVEYFAGLIAVGLLGKILEAQLHKSIEGGVNG